MESLGLQCGKSFPFTKSGTRMEENQSRPTVSFHRNRPLMNITRACSTIQNLETCCISSYHLPKSTFLGDHPQQQQQNKKKIISPEKFDEWMQDSVSEIVRNIGEAPFLVHVYSPTISKKMGLGLELEREKAVEESWPGIKRRWKEGSPIPDGVILVEQLGHEKGLEEDDDPTTRGTGTRAWGVLIQGRGLDVAACYILKTCRVWSSFGFCTHFCLVRANCFGESVELQLQNSWNGIGS